MRKRSILRGGSTNSSIPPVKIRFDSIVHNYNNMVFRVVDKDLHISNDYGTTFDRVLHFGAMLSEIRFIHYFSNGRLLIGDNRKLAYSNDLITLAYSNVLDENGNVFTPILTYDNFSTVNGTSVQKMDGGLKEVLMWGNYNNSENTTSTTDRAYIWYTENYGATVRCIFRFGVSIPVNKSSTLPARHIHGVEYNSADNSFWACTGDEDLNTYAHWVKFTPNPSSPTKFDANWINTGARYMVSNMLFVGDYIYCSWDVAGGGLTRVKYTDVLDPSKFEDLKIGLNDILCVIVKNNNALIVQSRWKGTQEGRLLWYSPDLASNEWVEILGG